MGDAGSTICQALLLGWLLQLDEAHRRRRILRKAVSKFKQRALARSFEGWIEFQRRAKETRMEARVVELEARAAAAEAAEAAGSSCHVICLNSLHRVLSYLAPCDAAKRIYWDVTRIPCFIPRCLESSTAL